MRKREIEQFRSLLLQARSKLIGDNDSLEENALSKTRADSSGDLSQMPIHFADIGSDTFNQEFNLNLMENVHDLLSEINAALDRISEGNFGKCEECGGAVPVPRLRAIPYTRYCIKCQEKMEKNIERPS